MSSIGRISGDIPVPDPTPHVPAAPPTPAAPGVSRAPATSGRPVIGAPGATAPAQPLSIGTDPATGARVLVDRGTGEVTTSRGESGAAAVAAAARLLATPAGASALARSGLSAAVRRRVTDAVSAATAPPSVGRATATPGPRQVTFVYDAGPHRDLKNLKLKGSFDASGAFDPSWNGGAEIPMRPLGNGKWAVTVTLQDDGRKHDWRWGVTADGPTGKGQWAVMGEEALEFDLASGAKEVTYAPTTYHMMGAQRQGNDLTFGLWAPNARDVTVKITKEDGTEQKVPMTRDDQGVWHAKVAGGFDRLVWSAYTYEITTSDGRKVNRADPYAREMQGEQRGIGRMFVNNATGAEVNAFDGRPKTELMRFEIGQEAVYEGATLVFKDDSGRQLTKDELLRRLGTLDAGLVSKIRGGKFDDYWANNVDAQGNIKMAYEGGTWTALVNNPEKLEGLHYELRVWEKDPATGRLRLHDDKNHDGVFSDAERRASPNDDHWSDVITKESGRSFRGSIITDSRYAWRNDGAPRETDQRKWTIYQLHPGSIFGSDMNSRRSTFDDIQKRLDYFKTLGVNTLEFTPTNEVEGERDWGYMGANSLAVESTLGFEDESGKWVTGNEALKRLVDEAHKRGLNVINDVVYNHVGGEHNFLSELDGPEDPYFNWATEPGKLEHRDTPWGRMPAYNKPQVRQLFVDHAVAQIEEFHFDGLRFDFTQPIKGTGGKAGWDMLREINRQIHFYKPNAHVSAEQFDYDPSITQPSKPDGTGGGFDAQWYTEFQHRLVHDNDNPSIIQQAVNGQRTDMDRFMNLLTNPRGLSGWRNAVTIISDHDEVGNAERTINVADKGQVGPDGVPAAYARGLARFAAGMGFAAPGMPMFFEGDESLASNEFRWGVPSTWDVGWDWQDPRNTTPLAVARRQTFDFYRDAIALRKSSPAFDADAAVERVYTHNDNSVLAFTRKKDGDEFLIVGSLNRQNFSNYRMDLPPGRWKEVLNSDSANYGGGNFGNGGGTIDGGSGASVNIPSAGYVVLKKIG
jgi:1,4-alpha-glucan branching enzyme